LLIEWRDADSLLYASSIGNNQMAMAPAWTLVLPHLMRAACRQDVFREGFDTRDLKDVKMLLEELAVSS
jgi:hypothetical protein